MRARLDDFRAALERRDEEAYRVALADLHRCLVRWTDAQERILLPVLSRLTLAGRDPARELRLEWVQVRELTRYLLWQVTEKAPLVDILGLSENLDRRFAAHETEMAGVYYPAAAPGLTDEQWSVLAEAASPL